MRSRFPHGPASYPDESPAHVIDLVRAGQFGKLPATQDFEVDHPHTTAPHGIIAVSTRRGASCRNR